MITLLSLSLSDAQTLAQVACTAASDAGFPVCVAVVDKTTYLQVAMRMDGAPLFAMEGALDKARSAAEGGHPTTFFEEVVNKGRFSVMRLPHTPVEGGVPVIVDGACVGAVGVAGAPPEIDARIARTAIDRFLAGRST